ncbi:uncharacterized protein [Montipora capricornis]|uniref:uncharacterized protein n=1 Tax=Montipora capricornis TaxID=246305 RepID=UPI0035F1FBC5
MTEIEELISSEGVLIKQLAIAKAELEADKETYKQYWMKMEAHAKLVELHEMNSELNQSSKKQRREGRMVEDEESLIRIGDESGVERIQAETIQLKERRKYLQEAIALTQSELQNQKEKHAQLKREADTLHKRKRAYLSRIKRHTQEAMSRQSSTMAE